jgi:Holliday junction resolvase RusA-like endonuclease
MAAVEIPVPPSVNNLWRAVRTKSAKVRLIKSSQYDGWLAPAVFLLRAGLPTFRGRVAVRLTIRGGKEFSTRRDLDNCLKAVLDALRYAGRIEDDTVKTVRACSVEYAEPESGKPATCWVAVTPADA